MKVKKQFKLKTYVINNIDLYVDLLLLCLKGTYVLKMGCMYFCHSPLDGSNFTLKGQYGIM